MINSNILYSVLQKQLIMTFNGGGGGGGCGVVVS